MEKEYFESFDLLKGILIILVILGWAILGSHTSEFSRYIIYSFHMPLFFGVTGFLLLKGKLSNLSFLELLKKYFRRMMIPWMIVVLLVFFLGIQDRYSQLNIKNLLLSFIFPVSHLWFIIDLFIFIIILWFCIRKNISNKILFSLLIPLAIIPLTIRYLNLTSPGELVYNIISVHRPDFFIFFVLGFVIRNNVSVKKFITNHLNPIVFIIILLIVFRVIYFFMIDELFSSVFYSIDFYLLNIVLIACIFGVFLKYPSISHLQLKIFSWLQWIGRNSLGVYLYSGVIVMALRFLYLRSDIDTLAYYSLTLVLIPLLIISIYLFIKLIRSQNKIFKKFRFLETYLFGT